MPGLALKCKQLDALKYLYMLKVMFFVGSNRLWHDVDLIYQTLPFLLDVKLDRISAPLTERSVVLVISSLVALISRLRA